MARRRTESSTKKQGREVRQSEVRQREVRRKKARSSGNSWLRWGVLGLLGLVILAGLIWWNTRPVTAMGEEITIGNADHVPEGTDSGPYQTDPPTGGKHYPSEYEAGFYDEASVESLQKNYEGYLVHNLEHGYIIYWYNCSADPNLDCDQLKQTIRQVMDDVNNVEVIAFPWPSQKEPLVITSWGRILRMDQPDAAQMREFYNRYHNVAPEPMAE